MRKSQKEVKDQLKLFRSDLRALKRWLAKKKGRYMKLNNRYVVSVVVCTEPENGREVSLTQAIWLSEQGHPYRTVHQLDRALNVPGPLLHAELGYTDAFSWDISFACSDFLQPLYSKLKGTRREIAWMIARTFGLVPARG